MGDLAFRCCGCGLVWDYPYITCNCATGVLYQRDGDKYRNKNDLFPTTREMKMNKIKKLQQDGIITPQCSYTMDEKQWNTDYLKRRIKLIVSRNWNRNQCNYHSSYLINDKYYCTIHARKIALQVLLQEM